jgi:hypothetical protein
MRGIGFGKRRAGCRRRFLKRGVHEVAKRGGDGPSTGIRRGACDGGFGVRCGRELTFRFQPIFRQRTLFPNVRGSLEFDSDLEKFADRVRTLNPSDAGANVRMRVRQFQRNPRVAREMVLGRVLAAVQIERKRTGTLFERLTEKIRAAYDEWKRFKKALTAASFPAGLG